MLSRCRLRSKQEIHPALSARYPVRPDWRRRNRRRPHRQQRRRPERLRQPQNRRPQPRRHPQPRPRRPRPAEPIGNVATLTGSATVTRNNTSTPLKPQDDIFLNDVLQTSANSTLGITFNDATTFNLTANAIDHDRHLCL